MAEFFARNGSLFQGNQKITIKGTNFFGLETETYCLHGLWSVSLASILDFVQANGFNALRIPFSAEIALGLDTIKCKSINTFANPDLVDCTAGQLFDKLVDECAKRGILVMPDLHRLVGTGKITELWYDNAQGYSEAVIIQAWTNLLRRYRSRPNVFAADLKNEPHGVATWGSGDLATDWHAAAQRIGNALLDVNPRILIVVEGVERHNGDNSWWGGTVAGAATAPVVLKVPNKVVYSPHVYGPSVFAQPYFADASFPSNLTAIWDRHFGFMKQSRTGTLLIGEWGGTMNAAIKDDVWQNAMGEYFAKHDIDWFYWCVNPNSGDTGGLLMDDWKTPVQPKLNLLKRICPNPTTFAFGTAPTPVIPTPPLVVPTPPPVVPTPTPVIPTPPPVVPSPTPVVPSPTSVPRVTIALTSKNSWMNGRSKNTQWEVTITNRGSQAIGENLKLRLRTGRLQQIWNIKTNTDSTLSFPEHVTKHGGLAPGQSFVFGFISEDPQSGNTSVTTV
jgi:endoglucanase